MGTQIAIVLATCLLCVVEMPDHLKPFKYQAAKVAFYSPPGHDPTKKNEPLGNSIRHGSCCPPWDKFSELSNPFCDQLWHCSAGPAEVSFARTFATRVSR